MKLTSDDVLKRLPKAQRDAIRFIDAQIESLEDQIENLKAAKRTLGFIEINDDDDIEEPVAPKLNPLPMPMNRIQEGKQAGYKIDNQRLLAQIGCLLIDGPLPMGKVEVETGVSRGALYPRMSKCPWFQVNGEKSTATWGLSPSGMEAAKTGFKSDVRNAVATVENLSTSEAG